MIFVNPPLTMKERYGDLSKAGSHLPPMALCNLAAVVRSKGVNAYIIDAPAINYTVNETVNEILRISPDSVGFTAATVSINNAAAVAKELREVGFDKPIILGGPHVTALPERTLEEYPHFDYAAIGEAEETIIDIINNGNDTDSLENISGLVIRKNGKVIRTQPRDFIKNLDELPFPAWDLLPDFPNNYSQSSMRSHRAPSACLITSRGCYGQCTFCDTSVFGRHIRAFSAEYVIAMIQEMIDKYGIKDIAFYDDNFIVNSKRLEKICNYITNNKIDLTWSCDARIDTVKSIEKLRMMKAAGCWQICYGIESGSQEILDEEKKNTKIEKIEEVVLWTAKTGIKVKGFFMMGHPLETVDSMRKTIDFAKKLPLSNAHVTFVTPLPGTELYKTAASYGEFDCDWRKMNMWSPVFVPKDVTLEQMYEYKNKFFREFYLRPRIIWDFTKEIRSLKQIEGLANGFTTLMLSLTKKKKNI